MKKSYLRRLLLSPLFVVASLLLSAGPALGQQGSSGGNNPAPTPPHKVRLEWVRAQTPVARTTHFFIYRLRD